MKNVPPKIKSFCKQFRETKALYLFVIPGLIFYLLFKYYPIYGSQIAFRDYSPFLGFWNSPWVGLKHFERFFNSPDFWKIIKNTLVINLANLIFAFPFPILLAIMLNQLSSSSLKKVIQTVTYTMQDQGFAILVFCVNRRKSIQDRFSAENRMRNVMDRDRRRTAGLCGKVCSHDGRRTKISCSKSGIFKWRNITGKPVLFDMSGQRNNRIMRYPHKQIFYIVV